MPHSSHAPFFAQTRNVLKPQNGRSFGHYSVSRVRRGVAIKGCRQVLPPRMTCGGIVRIAASQGLRWSFRRRQRQAASRSIGSATARVQGRKGTEKSTVPPLRASDMKGGTSGRLARALKISRESVYRDAALDHAMLTGELQTVCWLDRAPGRRRQSALAAQLSHAGQWR